MFVCIEMSFGEQATTSTESPILTRYLTKHALLNTYGIFSLMTIMLEYLYNHDQPSIPKTCHAELPVLSGSPHTTCNDELSDPHVKVPSVDLLLKLDEVAVIFAFLDEEPHVLIKMNLIWPS